MPKKKIALGVLGILALAVAGFAAYVASRPSSYTVVRSHVVNGTPDVVAPYLTDLRQWILWNPWDELEPTSIKEYSEPASGVGAWYTWSGEEVGSGIGRAMDVIMGMDSMLGADFERGLAKLGRLLSPAR